MPSTLDRSTATFIEVPRGLHNVVVTETEIGDVRGLEGFYHYRQYSALDLARSRDFEDVWYLMLFGELPNPVQRREFDDTVRSRRALPAEVAELLPRLAALPGSPLSVLRTAWGVVGADFRPGYDLTPDARVADTITLSALTPTVLAAVHRLRAGLPVLEPLPELGHAANYLYLLTGRLPDEQHRSAIERYLIATIDHGFNASTFTARVIASTGADVAAAVIGAVGALSGPLHGGAPSRALDTLDAIGTADRAAGWIREAVGAGHRIMGFGHPVYRTEDPRSVLLREVAAGFGGELVELAVRVEAEVEKALAELKPGRELHTNVEFYAGVVMELCGIPREMFTPTFAVARVVGWCANILEQAADGKIIRPAASYVGPAAPAPLPDAR